MVYVCLFLLVGCGVILFYTPNFVEKRTPIVKHLIFRLTLLRQSLQDNRGNSKRVRGVTTLELNFIEKEMDEDAGFELTIIDICNHLLDEKIISIIDENNTVVQYIIKNKSKANKFPIYNKKELTLILSLLIHDEENYRRKSKVSRPTSVFNLKVRQKELSDEVAVFLFSEFRELKKIKRSLYSSINSWYNERNILEYIDKNKKRYSNILENK